MVFILNLLLWPVGAAAVGLLLLAAPPPHAGKPADCSRSSDPYGCIVAEAVRRQEPTLCEVLNAADDDRCMFDVYREVNDPELCAKLTRRGVREACRKEVKADSNGISGKNVLDASSSQ